MINVVTETITVADPLTLADKKANKDLTRTYT